MYLGGFITGTLEAALRRRSFGPQSWRGIPNRLKLPLAPGEERKELTLHGTG